MPTAVKLNSENCDPSMWINKYAGYLNFYASKKTGDYEQAKDLVQETFLAALENLERFEMRCSEKTWLVAILRNKIVDHYRKNQTEQNFRDNWSYSVSDCDLPCVFDDGLPELNLALQKLPVLWQKVFLMKNIEERSTREICNELSISDSNVWVILHRTRGRLCKQMKPYYF